MPPRRVSAFERSLIAGAREALAISRGKLAPARIAIYSRTARDVDIAPPPRFNAKRVQQLRERMKVSQSVFADMLNVSASLVRAWEQGVRSPAGAAARLLQLFEREPTDVERIVLDKPTLEQSRKLLVPPRKKRSR
jgi:putative transcriptional regulator